MFKKQSTFLQNAKRYLEPVALAPKEAIKSALCSLQSSLYFDILPVVSIPLLITYVASNNTKAITTLLYIVVAVLFIAYVVRLYCMKGWYWFSYLKFQAELEKKYRSTILLKDNVVFETKGTGKVQSIVDRGIGSWSSSVNDTMWYIVSTTVTLSMGIYVLYKIGIVYVLIFVGLLIFSSIWYLYYKNKQYKIKLEEYDIQTEYTASQIRSIMSRQEIVFSNKVNEEAQNLHDLSLSSQKVLNKSDIYGVIAGQAIECIMIALPFAGVLAYYYFTDVKTLSTDQTALMTLFIIFSARMSVMVWSFFGFVGRIIKDYPYIKKFWDFLDNTPDMIGYDTGNTFVHRGGSIILENINFKYGENIAVLKDFNLHIKGGEKVAFVGHSGSGKTTIAKLITGYMRPTSGSLVVDGQNLNQIALKTYYPYIGYLTQEPMVFDGSIRDNLLYGVSNGAPTKQDLESALKKSECDFVLNMKDGLETQIGEKGVRLSGGERQRLAIAKLLLKNPEIIVLDEPTSALDSFSEDAVTKAMNELFVGRTVIIIAHRLQTVKNADRIIVLEKGRIVEEGAHTELVKKSGTYARMLEMQSGF